MDPDERYNNQTMPPRDYSAAYVQELISQGEMAVKIIEMHLDVARTVLEKLQSQIAPF